MLSAIGTHGPTVSPIAMGLLNTAFLAVAVWLLVKPQKNSESWFWPLLLFVGLATFSRIALSFIPNVMPVTIMAVMVGSKFGAQRGISFAILVTLASNAVLGHGWWSLFQMIGMGIGCGCCFGGERLRSTRKSFDDSTCLCILVECSNLQYHCVRFDC